MFIIKAVHRYKGSSFRIALFLFIAVGALGCNAESDLTQQMWVKVENLERRTCNSNKCGIVGKLRFDEQVKVFEIKNEWARVSQFLTASCSQGTSQFVISGTSDCIPQNGISNGNYAEWVNTTGLSLKSPKSFGIGKEGIAKILEKSDDFIQHRDAFVIASETLIYSRKCSVEDIINEGGWWKSINHGKSIYFMYCKGGKHRIYLDVSDGRTFT